MPSAITPDIESAEDFLTGPVFNMTARLPRRYHNAVKDRAKGEGRRASDLYVDILSRFITDQLGRRKHMHAVTDEAVPISFPVPSGLAQVIRSKARDKGVGANELIYTAVAEHLDAEV